MCYLQILKNPIYFSQTAKEITMTKRKPGSLGRNSGAIAVDPKTMKDLGGSLRAAATAREAEERRLRACRSMPIDLRVGVCTCGGEIILKSRVKFIPDRSIRVGARRSGHSTEEIHIFCTSISCGLSYSTKAPRFVLDIEKVGRLRDGETE